MTWASWFLGTLTLLPAAETVFHHRLAGVEVASWRRTSRIQFARTLLPWCHHMDAADYFAVLDPTDYTRPSSLLRQRQRRPAEVVQRTGARTHVPVDGIADRTT